MVEYLANTVIAIEKCLGQFYKNVRIFLKNISNTSGLKESTTIKIENQNWQMPITYVAKSDRYTKECAGSMIKHFIIITLHSIKPNESQPIRGYFTQDTGTS